jgi:DnaJ-class molecular chaperone
VSDAIPDNREICRACRGTGRVISALGGTAHAVTCPWCDGGGRWLPGHDAQAAQPSNST